MTEKILACPFCGGDGMVSVFYLSYVRCTSCGAFGPEADTKDDAILLWNAAANALAEKDAEIEELKELQIRLEEQNRQYSMNWQTELRRVEAGDKRQDELEAEIDKLRKERDAVIDRAAKAILALDELKTLYSTIDAEIEKLRGNLSALDMIANAMQHQRDEARRVARRLYATNKELIDAFARRPRTCAELMKYCQPRKVTTTGMASEYQHWYDTHTGKGYIVRNDEEQP